MYCSNCGKKLSPDDYFCSNCGTPVKRQGLFNDVGDAHEDQFEETRLFTAEELGQYLNDVEEMPVEEYDQAEPEKASQPLTDEIDQAAPNVLSSQDKKVDPAKAAGAAMAGAASAAGAFASKFKGKFGEMKARQAQKKQAADAAKAAEAVQESEPAFDQVELIEEDFSQVVQESPKKKAKGADLGGNDETISFKKIALPVIVLGLIIGLVIGLVIIQPWSGGDEEAGTDPTAAAVINNIE